MKRTAAPVLLSLAAAVAIPSPVLARAPKSRSRSCVGPRARVLARGPAVAVYETSARVTGTRPAIWACLAGHAGHMTLLAGTLLNARVSLEGFELAGHIAAYLETQRGVDTSQTNIVVVDVGARRVLRAQLAGDSGPFGEDWVGRFLVTSRGSVAWTSTSEERRGPAVVSVYAAPREGSSALLDRGAAIDAGSLSRSGTTLSWSDGGTVHTAPLP